MAGRCEHPHEQRVAAGALPQSPGQPVRVAAGPQLPQPARGAIGPFGLPTTSAAGKGPARLALASITGGYLAAQYDEQALKVT
jgi:hypothetical protein